MDTQPGERCPFLQERLVNYCSAAQLTKFVPFSTQTGRCGTDSYRFCEAYLELARPAKPEEMHAPPALLYSPNHMWLHSSGTGTVHVGIDGFLAHLLGSIDQITFTTLRGMQRPSAVLSVGGVDWPLVFPNPMLIASANLYLRCAPNRIVDDPYGAGWLFEGKEPAGGNVRQGLITGDDAQRWADHEQQRLLEQISRIGQKAGVANDGGSIVRGVMRQLSREETLRLCHEFFAPHASFWREI
jgi:glycine cleavage system H lipoate-binding protein